MRDYQPDIEELLWTAERQSDLPDQCDILDREGRVVDGAEGVQLALLSSIANSLLAIASMMALDRGHVRQEE